MREPEEQITRFLKEKDVKYEVFEHKPVYTCEKMAKYLKADQDLIAKSMILEKSKGEYILAVLPGRMRIDYLKLSRIANTKSLSLAEMKEAEKIAGCSVGCVYPLGNLLGLPTYFDKKLLRYDYIFFNPGSHVKSIRINTDALVRMVKPTIGDFSKKIGK